MQWVARAAGAIGLILIGGGAMGQSATAPAMTTTGRAAANADWYQFMGPTRNGIVEGPKLLAAWGKNGPKVVWRKPCLTGYSGPIIKDGVLVLMERAGNRRKPVKEEVIRGLNAATGEELWRRSYPCDFKGNQYVYGPAASPAAVGDKVVCLSINGRLRCLELATGKDVWEKDLVAAYGIMKSGGHSIYDSASSPLVVGEMVILWCSGSAGLVGLRVADGKELWKTPAFSNYGSSTGFMWQGKTPVVIAVPSKLNRKQFDGGDVLGFDARDGRLLWTGRAGKAYYNTPCPIAANGMLFVEGGSGDGPTYAFTPPQPGPGTGRAVEAWKDADHQVRFSNYLCYRGLLFGQGWRAHGGPKKSWCAEPATGKLHWETRITEKYQYQWMIGSDGKIIQFYDRGELVLLDADARGGRKELARAKVSDRTWSHPAVCGGRIYIRTNTQVKCLLLARR